METPLNKRIKAYRAIITFLENRRNTNKANEKDTIGLVINFIKKAYNDLIHQKADANETADVAIQPFANLLDKGREIKANKASQQENQKPTVVKKPIPCNEPSKTTSKQETPLNKRINAYRAIITFLENRRSTNKVNEKDTIGLVLDCIKQAYNDIIHQKADANETADVAIQPFANLLDKGGEIKANKTSQQENQQPTVVKKPLPSNEPSKTTSKQTPLTACNLSKAEKDKKDGDSLFFKKLYGDAIFKYSRAIEFNPGDVSLFFKRGVAYSFLALRKQSISDFERAVELDPSFKAAYLHLVMEYIVQGRFSNAKQVLLKVISYEPENKELRFMLDFVEKENLVKRKNRSSTSESPHFNFNTENPTSKYSEDISRAAAALLREPSAANIINGLLQKTRGLAKQNPVLEVLIYMKDKLDLNQMHFEYKLPLKYHLETYTKNKE